MIVNQVEAACIHLLLHIVAYRSSLLLQQLLKKSLTFMILWILSTISQLQLLFWLMFQPQFQPILGHMRLLLLHWEQLTREKVELRPLTHSPHNPHFSPLALFCLCLLGLSALPVVVEEVEARHLAVHLRLILPFLLE
jgi:hypothetical protein